MEVHKHPHHVTHKKKWGEYLLEFFMLFLAVTLGFFAESYREHLNDRSKEKEYMRSLIEDLKYDTLKYQKAIKDMEILNPALDSSYINAKEAARFNYILQGKWQFAVNEINIEYIPGLPTIQQMKSSGNLRLIENRDVGNKIMEYEAYVKSNIERLSDNIHVGSAKVYAMEDRFCDYINFRKINVSGELDFNDTAKSASWDMPIIERDVIKLNEFANSFINYKTFCLTYLKSVKKEKNSATELINLITREYHF